jgi:hypothetical protein
MLRNLFLLTFCMVFNIYSFSQCPTTAQITTNNRCISLNWSSPQSLPLPPSFEYNNSTYNIISGSSNVFATYQNNSQGNCSGSSRPITNTLTYNNNTCNYSPLGILPLNFIKYNSTFQSNELKIEWTTTNEINIEYYKIEMSSNGEEWDSRVLGVNLLDQRSAEKVYSTTVSGILVKPNYLRLVGVDFDGSETKTKIFTPDAHNIKEISIAPNPTNGDRVVFSCFDCVATGNTIDILTTDGRKIKTVSKIFNGDILDVSDLPKGLYFLKVSDGTHLTSELTKLVRN